MHLETLKVFCDIVETRSFSTAASKNFVTQSAVSQQIRMLEQRYGQQLLERTRGNVQLTPAGEILYETSKGIIQSYFDMEARLQAVSDTVAGTVRVGTVHSIGLYELSSPIKRFLTT
jgi:DNA-binding transcriptional LysR family regulator